MIFTESLNAGIRASVVVEYGLAPPRHNDAVPELQEFKSEGEPNAR